MFRTVFLPLCMVCLSWGVAAAQDWQPMFDGYSFRGWTLQNGKPVDVPGWTISRGVVHLNRDRGRGGNLLTDEVYGDFELIFEWKIAEGGNNGVKYRVNDFGGRVLGIEYQMIDDHTRQLKPRYRTASLYDIYEPKPHNRLRPTGEYNRSRILVRDSHIEHWLNGYLVAEAEVGSDAWQARLSKSKFAKVEGFGVTPTGRIMLTDHGDKVWYRNMFIRRFDVMAPQHVVLDGITGGASSLSPCVDVCPPKQRKRVCRRRRR